jgi:hypothetical protein
MPQEPPTSLAAKLSGVAIVIFLTFGGFEAIENYVRSKQPHDLLATLHYKGEWTNGEYRECESTNLKEYDQPDVVCADGASVPAKTFKIRFTGHLYDPKLSIGQMLDWTCRRVDGDVTFSCVRKAPDSKPQ